LDQPSTISVIQDNNNILETLNITESAIVFTLNEAEVATDPATVLLVPEQGGCSDVSVELFILRQVITVTLNGGMQTVQPGTTVTTSNACLPPECGDNSTDYEVVVNGQELQKTEESSDIFFAIRFPDTNMSYPSVELFIQTFYSLVPSGATVSFRESPPITSITPSMGQRGTRVVIEGGNLLGFGHGDITFKRVWVGHKGADIDMTNSDTTHISARINSDETDVSCSSCVIVNTTQRIGDREYDGPYTYSDTLWTQLEDGVVTELFPPAVQIGGTLRICGERLLGGGSSVQSVSIVGQNVETFGGVTPNPNPDDSTECIAATVPDVLRPEDGVSGNIIIEADTGAIVENLADVIFTYANITNVDPAGGQVGTEVTIAGVELLSGYSGLQPTVFLSSIEATVLTVATNRSRVTVRVEDPGIIGSGDFPLFNLAGDVVITVTRDGQDYNVSMTDGWTYLESGQIEQVEPAFGQFGTRITLRGTNLIGYGTDLRGATIGNASAGILSTNSSVVELEAPDISFLGLVDIVLESNNGAIVSLSQAFEYRERGIITNLNPPTGQNGTFVTISGSNLFGHAASISGVTFGGIEAEIDFTATTNSQIRVRIQSNDVTSNMAVQVIITATTMARVTSSGNVWTYLVPGAVTNVQPSIGQVGTIVTIFGTNLLGGGNSVQSIRLDGVTATVNASSPVNITVTMNDLSQQITFYRSSVHIVADTGAVITGGTYTHQVSGMITDIDPRMGREGTRITITGNELFGYGNGINEVLIAGSQGTIVGEISTSMIFVRAGAAASGTQGPISLISDTGAVVTSPSLMFTYTQQGNISDVSPSQGAEGSGVLIQGMSLRPSGTDIISITIGGSPVSRIVTQSDNEVSVIVGPAPENENTSAVIVITASDGSLVRGGSFEYLDLIISLPTLDQGQRGTQVQIRLPNDMAFDPSLSLVARIGGQTAGIIGSDLTEGTIDVRIPRAGQVGTYTVDVTVEGVDGRVARLRDGFTYVDEGVICSVTPNSGQQGTRIEVIGRNLLGGGSTIETAVVGEREGLEVTAVVMYADNDRVDIVLESNLPPGTTFPLVGEVTLIADTGAIITAVGVFTLVQPGQISSVSPAQGQFGTVVTINGANLLQGGAREDILSITLASVEVFAILDSPSSPSDSQITVRADTSMEERQGPVNITLTTGAYVISPESETFQYLPPGRIDALNPRIGTVGTRVTIEGANLLGGGSVQEITLGGTMAVLMNTPTDSQIEVRAQQPMNGSGAGNGSGVVEILIDTGAVISGSLWEFEELGVITSISPLLGQQGVTVTARGTSLLGSSANEFSGCRVANIPGTVSLSLDNEARCVVAFNPSAGINTNATRLSGPLQLAANSGPTITSADEFRYYVAYIEEIEPYNGTNGTYVTVTGENLIGPEGSDDLQVASVTFGGHSTLTGSTTILSRDSIRVRVGHSPVASSNNNVRVQLTSEAFLELENAWQYTEPGQLVSVSPETALPGATVSITGTNIVPPCVSEATVIVGQTRSYEVTIVSSSEIRFRPGPYQREIGNASDNLDSPGITVPIQVIASNGATVYSDSVLFRYEETAARVTAISPIAGTEGTNVTISGINLLSGGIVAARVTLAGQNATIINASDTEVTVLAGEGPANGSRGRVIIEAENGRVSGIGTDVWEYLPAITAADVSPQTGQNGTLVTIDLKGIFRRLSIREVYLADVLATDPIASTEITIIIEANASPQTPVGDIRVEFEGDVVLTIPDAWSYLPPTEVSSVTPDQGYFNTSVTISGANFQAGGRLVNSVRVAGLETELISQDNTELVVRVTEFRDSSANAIVGPITITSEDGATYTTDNIEFTYVQLQVADITPESGQGGTVVTITGVGLLAGSPPDSLLQQFLLAGVEVQSPISISDIQIEVVASPSPDTTNTNNITYTVAYGGYVVIPNAWSYLQPGRIASITPSQGAQGSYVTIRGENMLQGGATVSEVTVADVQAMEIVVGFADFVQIRLGESPDRSPGSATVVSDTGARIESTFTFDYTSSGNISDISPEFGHNGTRVTISGTGFINFGAVSRITLAGIEATIVGQVTDFSLTVEAGRPDIFEEFRGRVVIETDSGTIITGDLIFEYLQEGVIYTAYPPQGQMGTRVTISGERLFGYGTGLNAAYLAGVEADIDTTESNDSFVYLIATTSSTAPLTGDIILESNTGAFVRKINGWSYVEPGDISSVNPQQGQFGTRISITGIGLLSGGDSVTEIIIGSVVTNDILSSTNNLVEARVGRPDNTASFAASITLVSNFGGELPSTFSWTYLPSSEVTEVSPMSGIGGSIVNITGNNLLGGGTMIASVTTAGVPAFLIDQSMSNDNTVVFTVGYHPNGLAVQGDVVITSDTGAKTISENGWSYDSACPERQFGSFGNCMPCNEECRLCTGPTDEDCLVCEDFMIPLNDSSMRCVNTCPSVSTLDKVCVDVCNSNQYSGTDTVQNATFCYNCSSLCDDQLGCTGPNATECTGCEFARDRDSRACVSSCRLGTWMNEGRECVPCDSQCVASAGCFGDTNADCNECQNVRIASNYVDEGSNSSNQQIGDVCIERCPIDFYEDSNRYCLPCNTECRGGCTGPTAFDCMMCASASRAQANDAICVSTCNADLSGKSLYQTSNGSCQECSRLCSLQDGCRGPGDSDCNSCRLNETTNQPLPRFGNACVLSCPNTTASASPTPTQFYYHNTVTGDCELCHVDCTNGCTGPGAEDCREAGDEATEAFTAGAGTVGIAVGIILALVVICVALIIFMGWFWVKGSRQKGYKLEGTGGDAGLEMGNRYSRGPNDPQTSPTKKLESSEEGEYYTQMSPTRSVAAEVKERSQSPEHGPIVHVAERQYKEVTMIENEGAELYCEASSEVPPVVPARPLKSVEQKPKTTKPTATKQDRKSKALPPDPPEPSAAPPPQTDKQAKKFKPAHQPTAADGALYTKMTRRVPDSGEPEIYVEPDPGPDEEYSEMSPIHQSAGDDIELYEDTLNLGKHDDPRSPQKSANDKAPLIDDLYEETDTTLTSADYQKIKLSASASALPTARAGAPEVPKQPIPRKGFTPLPQTPLQKSLDQSQLYEIEEHQGESLYEAIPTGGNLPPAPPQQPPPEIKPRLGGNSGNIVPLPPKPAPFKGRK
jgi:hypothetical protein